MSNAEFDLNFSDLTPEEYFIVLGTFADLLLIHFFFKDNWPGYLTHPTVLKQQAQAFLMAAILAREDGGKKNLQDRDNLHEVAQGSLVRMAQYVVMRSVSENDPTFLTSVGLKLKKRTKKKTYRQILAMIAPSNPQLKHAKESGAVLFSCGKVAGAGTYDIWMCVGDPTVEGSWKQVGQYKGCRGIKIPGLTPATQVYFKVRCHGSGDPGPFTDPIGIIVL